MQNRQRILVYHDNPWGNGISLTFVWCTPFDGPLTDERKKFYENNGWVFIYEDTGPFPKVDTRGYDELFGFDTNFDISTVGEYIID
jgi:hypothetical protein